MYLLDTNIWLERLLEQERYREVELFFQRISSEHLHITDFSLHSIAIILLRLEKGEILDQFIEDLFMHGAVTLVRLDPVDFSHILRIIKMFKLDFDDAYQLAAAEKQRLALISFDSDFDRTDLGRKTPADFL
jgi:predicted nucleic acid-binding protein